jgi:outer membrane protein assembly factor BamB
MARCWPFDLHQSSPVIHQGVLYAHENGRVRAMRLPERLGERLKLEPLWETDVPRGQYQIPSPVIHDGRLYGLTMNGVLCAIDCESGETVYQERPGLAPRAYASLSLAAERLFAADQSGKVFVFSRGDEFRLLATNELELHPSSLVFDDKRLYLRTWRHLYCVGE